MNEWESSQTSNRLELMMKKNIGHAQSFSSPRLRRRRRRRRRRLSLSLACALCFSLLLFFKSFSLVPM